MNESTLPYRKATFDAAMKGLTAWQTALILNLLRPGIDYRGIKKTALREEYINGDLSHCNGSDLRDAKSKARL